MRGEVGGCFGFIAYTGNIIRDLRTYRVVCVPRRPARAPGLPSSSTTADCTFSVFLSLPGWAFVHRTTWLKYEYRQYEQTALSCAMA